MLKSKVASFSGKDGFSVFLTTHVCCLAERHETTKKLGESIRRPCRDQARLKTYGSLKPFLSFARRSLAPMIRMRRATRGSSPGLGSKTLLRLEDEETLRGSFVLRAFNAFPGAGTMVVVLLDER